jgi:hypothetical protein
LPGLGLCSVLRAIASFQGVNLIFSATGFQS